MYNDITIFTVDYGVPLEEVKRYKFCVDRWKEILPKNVTLKIFTKEDQIVKDCLEEFKDYFKIVEENCKTNYKYAYMCDVIRLYILSKNKHFLYLDSDLYAKDFSFLEMLDNEAAVSEEGFFYFLWSGDEPEKFGPFLSYYKEAKKRKDEIDNRDTNEYYEIDRVFIPFADRFCWNFVYKNINSNIKIVGEIVYDSFYHINSFKFGNKKTKYIFLNDKFEKMLLENQKKVDGIIKNSKNEKFVINNNTMQHLSHSFPRGEKEEVLFFTKFISGDLFSCNNEENKKFIEYIIKNACEEPEIIYV